MGFKSFMKQVIFGHDDEDAELQAARARHGIEVGDEKKVEDRPQEHEYDAWDELKNIRTNFFFGSWATRKYKHRVIGEEKVKKQLADLEKKREEEAAAKEKEEEGNK